MHVYLLLRFRRRVISLPEGTKMRSAETTRRPGKAAGRVAAPPAKPPATKKAASEKPPATKKAASKKAVTKAASKKTSGSRVSPAAAKAAKSTLPNFADIIGSRPKSQSKTDIFRVMDIVNSQKEGVQSKKAVPAKRAGHRTKDRTPVQISIPHGLYRQMKLIGAEQGVTMTDQILLALERMGYKIEGDVKIIR